MFSDLLCLLVTPLPLPLPPLDGVGAVPPSARPPAPPAPPPSSVA